MLDLNASLIFVCVVEENGFTAAADRLGMPKSTVSRRISDLEKHLGVRLLERSTRKVRLTSTGQVFFAQAQEIMHLSQVAEENVLESKLEPTGSLHIAASHLLCEVTLQNTIIQYMSKYQKVRVEITMADNQLNLFNQNVDIGFAVGPIKDSSVISKTLSATHARCYASPLFIETHGMPLHPNELNNLPIISYTEPIYNPSNSWSFERVLQTKEVESWDLNLSPHLSTPSFWLARKALLSGLGVARLPIALCQYEVSQGLLVPLFPDWSFPKTNLIALFPSRKMMSLQVRTFLNELEMTMSSFPSSSSNIESMWSQIRFLEPRTEFIQ